MTAKIATPTTVGTNTADTWSRPESGAGSPALETIATICAKTVSAPTLPASINARPFLLIVAPVTCIARSLFHRHRFTGQHAFIQR
jgi:hypothetical protein